MSKKYKLIGKDGKIYLSDVPGKFGGHRKLKIYGRLDCPSALRYIAKGQYVQYRVFFADVETAISAGYRPCGVCMKKEYEKWKQNSGKPLIILKGVLMKKKILSVIMTAVMLITSGCSTVKPAASDDIITATQMAEEMGIGLNLGNTMEAYNSGGCETIEYNWIPVCGSNTPSDYETQWGAVITTQEIIDGIKAAGFDTVRIPVFWGNMMENDGTYTINPDYMARVREIVDYAQNAGLYTVINIHHFDEFIIRRNSLEECCKIFTTLWTQIAEEFRDYPYTLVFEGFNEYLGGSQFNENGELVDPERADAFNMANTLNQTFVDAVRATGGNNAERVLVVSGYWTNIDLTTSAEFVVPTDTVSDRIMVSVHYVDNAVFWSSKIGGKGWLDYINSQCELLKTAFTDKGIPVFLGETTSIYPNSNFSSDAIYTDSTECLEIVLEKLNEYGFVPVLWDTSNNFYSRTMCRIKRESDEELIARLSEEFSE